LVVLSVPTFASLLFWELGSPTWIYTSAAQASYLAFQSIDSLVLRSNMPHQFSVEVNITNVCIYLKNAMYRQVQIAVVLTGRQSFRR
jgi:hypothetical protein